ncbi:MAG TPA: FeS-binding protein [Planctomycetes bacterium]|nr:FeS-binding protein [Planctomycetota bacterium]
MKTRAYLTFDRASLDQPILSTLTQKFQLTFNIFGATVNEDVQFVALELEGTEDRLEEALEYLRTLGVQVEIRDS